MIQNNNERDDMHMTAQNAAHAYDCGKVKVTLLNKRNAAEALTAPLNGKAIAVRGQHLGHRNR